MGATYDLFGNGKTALKVTLNKYLEGLGTTGALSDPPNPINRLITSTPRSWTDNNSNFTPECDLLNYAANGECGALVNGAIFGTVVPGTTYDPEVLTGWGKRFSNWEFTTSVQHELLPRLSVDLQYARRWYGNFRTMDDLAIGPADYDRFTRMLLATDASPAGELDGMRLLSPRTVGYMGRNHLPGNKDLETFGRPLYAESPFRGVGFGLGFAVLLDPVPGKVIGTAGELSWGGAASTTFWIDQAEGLTVSFFTQLLPSSTYPIRPQLRQLVYQALTG